MRAGDLTARTEQLQGELDAALLGLEQVTAERDHLIQQVAALQEQLAAGANTKPSPDGQSGEETTGTDTAQPQSGAAPADQNTPPTETAAKTAQKKGAAANTKA